MSELPLNEPNELTELLGRGLPKWPGIVIVGDKVTPEQAAEIIIRTDHAIPDPSCNDRDWCRELCKVMGIKYWMDIDNSLDGAFKDTWAKQEAVRKSVRHLGLVYLSTGRIASAYIGGPNGWCGWDGYIGENSKNVGKWPSCEEVYREWCKIAEAFPFLKLRCQLMDREQCEEGIEPVIEYHIAEGKVTVHDPEGVKLMDMQSDLSPAGLTGLGFVANAMNPRERGCTLETFEEAFNMVKEKFREQ